MQKVTGMLSSNHTPFAFVYKAYDSTELKVASLDMPLEQPPPGRLCN